MWKTIEALRRWPAHRWIVLLGTIVTFPYKAEIAGEIAYRGTMSAADPPARPTRLLDARSAAVRALDFELSPDAWRSPRFAPVDPVELFRSLVLGLKHGRCPHGCTEPLQWKLARRLAKGERGSLAAELRRIALVQWISRELTPLEAMTLLDRTETRADGTFGMEHRARVAYGREPEALSIGQLVLAWRGLRPCEESWKARITRNRLTLQLAEAGAITHVEARRASLEPVELGVRGPCGAVAAPEAFDAFVRESQRGAFQFYGRDVRELSVPQVAVVARGLGFWPCTNPELAREARNAMMDQLVRDGLLGAAEAREVRLEPVAQGHRCELASP